MNIRIIRQEPRTVAHIGPFELKQNEYGYFHIEGQKGAYQMRRDAEDKLIQLLEDAGLVT